MDSVIIEKLKKEIEKLSPQGEVERIGYVTKVSDGIAEISGLTDAVMSEMVLFDESDGKNLNEALESPEAVYGLVLNLEEELVKVVILGDTSRIKEGMVVKSTGNLLSIPVGEAFIGRVVNPLGEAQDGKGAIDSDKMYPIEREAYGVMDRQSVNSPIHTGIKAIDAMIPIGRGQRELIIGDRLTGKTTIAVDTIINQKSEPEENRPICIYVAIGQKESKTAQIVQKLTEEGAMDYTIIVTASSATPAALQFLAPFAGVTLAEYFMEQGKDALIIYDDLSKHAVSYRQMSLLLRRPPGREAYPGDIFYLHSRLLERAAKLSDEKGGGSITALPIIETQEGDVSAYISTNVISITDGQIFLDTDLFNKGLKPAVDAGISVSRVGSAAQTKAMKKVAGKIKLELAQFRELEAFMQFSQDLDEDTKKRIEEGQRLTEILKQNKNAPMEFQKQVPVIYAAINGLFSEVELDDVLLVESKLLEYIERENSGIFSSIFEEKDINEKTENDLKKILESFKNTHKELFTYGT